MKSWFHISMASRALMSLGPTRGYALKRTSEKNAAKLAKTLPRRTIQVEITFIKHFCKLSSSLQAVRGVI